MLWFCLCCPLSVCFFARLLKLWTNFDETFGGVGRGPTRTNQLRFYRWSGSYRLPNKQKILGGVIWHSNCQITVSAFWCEYGIHKIQHYVTGCPWSSKVMEFRKTIFQAWKVFENSKVMESHGKWWYCHVIFTTALSNSVKVTQIMNRNVILLTVCTGLLTDQFSMVIRDSMHS